MCHGHSLTPSTANLKLVFVSLMFLFLVFYLLPPLMLFLQELPYFITFMRWNTTCKQVAQILKLLCIKTISAVENYLLSNYNYYTASQ